MTNLITKWFIVAVALMLAAYFVPGIEVVSLKIALIVAALLGVVNIVIKPVLVILTLPINIITLGLFTFVINGSLFWFLASFVDGFYVDGLLTAILGALVVSAFGYVGEKIFLGKNL